MPLTPPTSQQPRLGSKPTSASTWYITKASVSSSTYLTTVTSDGRTWTTTSATPVSTYYSTIPVSATSSGAVVTNPAFNSAITNAPTDQGGLGIALFVFYILHFLFRV
jgi:hypothetical protein